LIDKKEIMADGRKKAGRFKSMRRGRTAGS